MKRGFTLIELLIVVAIIAILAAIAVPNMLEAQTRARVARVMSEQHGVATAMESYAVDEGRYPEYGNPIDIVTGTGSVIVFLPVRLTTPVAYLTTLPEDLFPGKRTGVAEETRYPLFYLHSYDTVYRGKIQKAGHVQEHFHSLTSRERPALWTAWSYGPDLADDHGVVLYDPTNGTISKGDLMRFGP